VGPAIGRLCSTNAHKCIRAVQCCISQRYYEQYSAVSASAITNQLICTYLVTWAIACHNMLPCTFTTSSQRHINTTWQMPHWRPCWGTVLASNSETAALICTTIYNYMHQHGAAMNAV
jgi:hypothetical protein